MAVKEENQIYAANVNSISYMVLSFVFFMLGATFILANKLLPCIGASGEMISTPEQSVIATIVGVLIGQAALVVLTFGAYFSGEKETHGILLGFVVSLLIGVFILVLEVYLYVLLNKEPVPGPVPTPGAVSYALLGDFSLPAYIAALFMLICGILLFFKKGNYKIIGTTYVIGALMFVFFARALQTMWGAMSQVLSEGGESTEALAKLLDAQTPLVVAGVFAIVAGILALYIGISKSNIVKAPLA